MKDNIVSNKSLEPTTPRFRRIGLYKDFWRGFVAQFTSLGISSSLTLLEGLR